MMNLSKLPVFYCNLFKVWTLFITQRLCKTSSLHWLLQEPLIYGSRLDISHDGPLPPLGGILLSSGVTTLGHLSRLAGKGFKNIDLVAGHLGIRSARIVDKVLENWRPALTQEEFKLLEDYAEGLTVPNSSDPYPNLFFSPNLEECKGVFCIPKT